MPTLRQDLLQILREEEPQGLFDLSPALGISVSEVLAHLEHVRKSVKSPEKFKIIAARCLKCGFIFRARDKLKSPGRCPKCRSSYIKDPRYTIERG